MKSINSKGIDMYGLKSLSIAIVATTAFAGVANAGTLTTTGTIAPVCKVDMTARSFDPTHQTLQNIAGVLVTCNKAGNKTLTVDAANGYFAGPSSSQVHYNLTLDLDGNLLPFNNVPMTSAAIASGIGAPDATVANGLPGNFSVALQTLPFLAGAYSESWDVTVG